MATSSLRICGRVPHNAPKLGRNLCDSLPAMLICQRHKSSADYLKFWKKSQPTAEEAAALVEEATEKRSPNVAELKHLAKHNMNFLRAKKTLDTKQPYKPPDNVEEKVRGITLQTCLHLDPKTDDWQDVSFDEDPVKKFKILSKLITEFAHDIPSSTMNNMCTVSDAVKYFQTEVSVSTNYENLDKLDLPRNLNIKMDYSRFDPKTQRTAFPGRDTIVTSIKYKRKYDSIKTREEKPGYVNHYYGY